jgi:hypothetical protein
MFKMDTAYGICDVMALILENGVSDAQRWTQYRYTPKTRLKIGPNAVLVAAGLHELKATSETR